MFKGCRQDECVKSEARRESSRGEEGREAKSEWEENNGCQGLNRELFTVYKTRLLLSKQMGTL